MSYSIEWFQSVRVPRAESIPVSSRTSRCAVAESASSGESLLPVTDCQKPARSALSRRSTSRSRVWITTSTDSGILYMGSFRQRVTLPSVPVMPRQGRPDARRTKTGWRTADSTSRPPCARSSGRAWGRRYAAGCAVHAAAARRPDSVPGSVDPVPFASSGRQ